MKVNSPYTCVSCDFYDTLEIFAMRKNHVKINYKNEAGIDTTIITLIKNLVTRNKEEFIVTLSDMEIRLDQIMDVNKV